MVIVMVMVQMGATDLASEAHMEKKFWHFVIHPHKDWTVDFQGHTPKDKRNPRDGPDSPTLLLKVQYSYAN